jgi:hypothetical protein
MARTAFLAACICLSLGAAAAGTASVEVPMRDPWVPPELAKQARVQPPSTGARLQAEVELKLRRRFDAAAGAQGLLTREQARAAGLGFIERHFDAIDRRHAGRVSYDDYREFLRSRGARLD